MDIINHPCFNADARHKSGRIHLPVAAKCNVQCNFCNRKFDCANESRPGVSTAVLKPDQAEKYLETILKQVPNIAVVGIAGPGDPFANAAETMETLERVHFRFPDKLLCLSTNGLYLAEYIPRLAELNVSHVTITVNAVNPGIGAEIYEWVYFNNKSYFGIEGAKILLDRQTEAIQLLKKHNIIVKINTVVIPRVNEFHVHEISEYTAKLGADVQNCIPLIPVEGTLFGNLHTSSPSSMRTVRAKASIFIKQMAHCARCRADAVGLLGEANSHETERLLIATQNKKSFTPSPFIAVSSSDGVSVNQHLGLAHFLWIYDCKSNKVELIEKRPIPISGDNRWEELTGILSDCQSLLVAGVGSIPLSIIEKSGIEIVAMEGSIIIALEVLFNGKNVPEANLRFSGKCGLGSSCSGSGEGCS